jgi:DNA gyrase/topoisomerase IV subunit A
MIQNKKTSANTKLKSTTRTSKKTPAKTTVSLTGGKNTESKNKITNKSITNFINTEYREYALYVLQHRGIPSFYDCLTNVQRVILHNAPKSFKKTLNLVGDVFASNYHHGDASIISAITRLARPVLCADNLLEGYGFFGTAVNPDASAPRYTSVRLNSKYDRYLNEYNYLNFIPPDDIIPRIHTSIPFGLMVGVNGIGVGYSSTILPRKLEDIENFLSSGKGSLVPYFKEFTGNIKEIVSVKKSTVGKKAWLIEGVFEEDFSEKKILIHDIPPVVLYSNYIKRLNKILEDFDATVQNNSKSKISIEINMNKYTSMDVFDELVARIQKSLKVIVIECIIFSKDNYIVSYDSIENYLLDFRDEIQRTELKSNEYKKNLSIFEISFYKAKQEFIEFMQKEKRDKSSVESFLTKYSNGIVNRLRNIQAYKITNEELKSTKEEQINEENNLKEIESTIVKLNKVIAKLPEKSRSISINFETMTDYPEEIAGVEVLKNLDSLEVEEIPTSEEDEFDEDETNENIQVLSPKLRKN